MNKFSLWNCVGTGHTRGSKGAWMVERTCRDSVYNQMRERERTGQLLYTGYSRLLESVSSVNFVMNTYIKR